MLWIDYKIKSFVDAPKTRGSNGMGHSEHLKTSLNKTARQKKADKRMKGKGAIDLKSFESASVR
jgi:hypothetical protein